MKILYFLPDRGGCGWYRMRQPAYWLNSIEDVEARYFNQEQWLNMSEENTELLRWADVVVTARLMGGNAFEVVRDYNPNALIVYDIDDDLLHIPPKNIAAENITPEHQESIKVHLANADLVSVSTPYLRELLLKYNDNIEVLPNCIHQEMLDLKPIEKDHVRVGWAGSVTHVEDVEPAIEGLLMALDKTGYQNMRPVFFGFLGAKMSTKFIAKMTYVQKPVTIDQYYSKLFGCGLDIGLAPIKPNTFNECKSAVKFYEYTAVGAATIASDVGPYKAEIKDGHRGILVKHSSPEAWRDAILDLYNNEMLRKNLIEVAKTWCRKNRDPKEWAKRHVKAYSRMRRKIKTGCNVSAPSKKAARSLVVAMLSWVPDVDEDRNERLCDLMQCLPRILARITWPNVKIKILDQASCADASWFIQKEARLARERGLDVEVIQRIDNMGIGPGMNYLFGLDDCRDADYFMKIDNDVIPPKGFDTLMMKAYMALEERDTAIGMLSLDPKWGAAETFGTRENRKCVALTEKINGHEVNWLKPNSTAVGMCRMESAFSYRLAGGHPNELKYGTDQIMADRFTAAKYINAHLLPYLSTRLGMKPIPAPLRHIGSTTEERKLFKKEELKKMTELRDKNEAAGEDDAGFVAHR